MPPSVRFVSLFALVGLVATLITARETTRSFYKRTLPAYTLYSTRAPAYQGDNEETDNQHDLPHTNANSIQGVVGSSAILSKLFPPGARPNFEIQSKIPYIHFRRNPQVYQDLGDDGMEDPTVRIPSGQNVNRFISYWPSIYPSASPKGHNCQGQTQGRDLKTLRFIGKQDSRLADQQQRNFAFSGGPKINVLADPRKGKDGSKDGQHVTFGFKNEDGRDYFPLRARGLTLPIEAMRHLMRTSNSFPSRLSADNYDDIKDDLKRRMLQNKRLEFRIRSVLKNEEYSSIPPSPTLSLSLFRKNYFSDTAPSKKSLLRLLRDRRVSRPNKLPQTRHNPVQKRVKFFTYRIPHGEIIAKHSAWLRKEHKYLAKSRKILKALYAILKNKAEMRRRNKFAQKTGLL